MFTTIVVSKNEDGSWELLDGQQRLTTIFILIRYIKKYRPLIEYFSLEFETREKSKYFLNTLSSEKEIDNSNIDFYYITSAMKYIDEWFSTYSDQQENKVFEFSSKLLNNVQIIWYDIGECVSEEDKIKIFTRLNIGKIPLTSAELIRSLLLQENNFDRQSDLKYSKQRQFEMATEWDQIENSLHDESFWYFIYKNSTDYSTRIELLFELFIEDDKPKNADPLWTFLKTQEYVTTRGTEAIEDIWKEIKYAFMILKEWYSDHTLYHYIGYLIAIGRPLKDIRQQYSKSTKIEFKEHLIKEIVSTIEGIDIEQLSFEGDKEPILKILLLHNIQTYVKSKSDSRFEFDKYHNNQWSLEHIHAQNSEELRTEKQWLEWLRSHQSYLGTDFKIPSKITEKEFKGLADKVYQKYNEALDESLDRVHGISNLALLTSEVNSTLSNSIFPVKRDKLINKDKEGKFIPLCTKNVFLKYYSKGDNQQLSFWSKEDREFYIEDIKTKIKDFVGDTNE